MTDDIVKNLGPLAPLAGTWEGGGGDDTAPSASRGVEVTPFRERMVFEPLGPVPNHEQVLYGLRYTLTAWKLGTDDAFHEDRGYYLWDAGRQQVCRCSAIPRGIVLIAGGTVAATAKEMKLVAEVGSATYGICSNPFLDAEFRTVRFEMTITIEDGAFSYVQDTEMLMKGRDQLFHHVDKNRLKRV